MKICPIKLLVSLLATAYFAWYASTAGEWHFIDNVNLLIHEAGHWIFMPFGWFLTVLGGSLNQILVPLIFIGYFFYRKDKYSAALLLFWLAVNLINISIYVGDAVKMQLPLLGGDQTEHDWNQLLVYLGQLPHTMVWAQTIKLLGLAIGLTAAILSFKYAISSQKQDLAESGQVV